MDLDAIWKEATEAAERASREQGERDDDGGSCGYAWAFVVPARGPLVTWCKRKNEEAEASTEPGRRLHPYGELFGYRPGWQFWAPGNYPGQSLNAKEAGAKAFAEVFCRHGIEMHWSSRVD